MFEEKRQPTDAALELIPSPNTITRLLTDRRYDQINELLAKAHFAIRASGDLAILDSVLIAARQICQACNVLTETAEWHRWAAEEAERQEQELKQLLQLIANLMDADDLRTKQEPYVVIPTAATINSFVGVHAAQSDPASPGLWQRLQNILLGREIVSASAQPKKQSAPYRSAQGRSKSSRPPESVMEAIHQNDDISPPQDHPNLRESDEAATLPFQAPEAGKLPNTQKQVQSEHAIAIYGLGAFQVYQSDQLIKDWPNRKSKLLFKYLLWNHNHPIAKESLMELFWPETSAEAARNNLNVTIYNLRQTLRQSGSSSSVILFQENQYLLNPDLKIWIDFEAFVSHFERGRRLNKNDQHAQAVKEFEAAEALYQGELYEEDRYDDWIAPHRQVLHGHYIEALDYLTRHAFDKQDYSACIVLCNKQLGVDACREDAHRQLILCYIERGQHYLAMRQFHRCVKDLKEQLDVTPSSDTVAMYEQIRANL